MSDTLAVPVGEMLREWCRRRALSQLALALEAEISQRHLSFIKSGRARASRDMLLRLAGQLGMPLRARNALLVAGGFAPVYPERATDDPGFQAAREAVETILRLHQPFPALAIDRHWSLIFANDGVWRIIRDVDPALLVPPVNVLRLALHPDGIAPKIRNLAGWRAHILHRLSQQIETSGDPELEKLEAELRAYPAPPVPRLPLHEPGGIAIPLLITLDGVALSFISATTVFGTATDITLSEMAIETFFPADDQTRDTLMAAVQGNDGPSAPVSPR